MLDEQLPGGAVGLKVDDGDDLLAEQDGQGEIAELPPGPGQVGLEQVVVAEKRAHALALDDQRIEGREEMHERLRLVRDFG